MENLGPAGRTGAYLFGPDVLYDVSAAIPDRISFGGERLPSVLCSRARGFCLLDVSIIFTSCDKRNHLQRLLMY